MIDVVLYWFCATFGGLFGSVGAVALIMSAAEGVQLDRLEMAVLSVMTALSPLLFFIAYRSWRKLNHPAGQVASVAQPAKSRA